MNANSKASKFAWIFLIPCVFYPTDHDSNVNYLHQEKDSCPVKAIQLSELGSHPNLSGFLSIRRTSHKDIYSANEPVVIDFEIDNFTKNLNLEIFTTSKPSRGFLFSVLNDGNMVEKTDRQRVLDLGASLTRVTVFGPGSNYKGQIVINDLYNCKKRVFT
jgi:hypothetical protein